MWWDRGLQKFLERPGEERGRKAEDDKDHYFPNLVYLLLFPNKMLWRQRDVGVKMKSPQSSVITAFETMISWYLWPDINLKTLHTPEKHQVGVTPSASVIKIISTQNEAGFLVSKMRQPLWNCSSPLTGILNMQTVTKPEMYNCGTCKGSAWQNKMLQ